MKVVNSEEFDILTKEGLVLVDFYAQWCGPCKMMSPVLEELENEVDDLTVIKVDTDRDPALAMKYGVQSIPNMILFKDGQPVQNVIGFTPKEDMLDIINQAI